MNRVVLGIVAVLLAVLVAAFLIFRRPAPAAPPGETATREAPAAAPKPATPATPAAEPSAAPSRRAAAPKPAAPTAAEPAPAPVVEAAPVVDTATLKIDSDVPGAQVFVDRNFIGTAPVTVPNLKPGSHQVNLSASGFDPFAQSVDLEIGTRELMVRFKEVKLDAKIAVIHKHRIGNCKGELVANASTIRYDTTNKDDAFSMPLTELDSFEVDYLDKSLKLKSKKGKSYVFNDPENNADRLFVFHRDVTKARDRIKAGDRPAQ